MNAVTIIENRDRSSVGDAAGEDMGEVGNTVTGADDRDRAAVGDAAGEGENGAVDANATAANVSACRDCASVVDAAGKLCRIFHGDGAGEGGNHAVTADPDTA